MLRIENLRQGQELKKEKLRKLRKEVEELDEEIKVFNAVQQKINKATGIENVNKILDRCKKERSALVTEREEKNEAILDGKAEVVFWQNVISVLEDW